MKIQYKFGDMFASDEKVIIHGCNARGVFGAGVAATMRRLHPAIYDAYMAHTPYGLVLGRVIWAESNGLLIGNAITQDGYGRNKEIVYADYAAIRVALRSVNETVAGRFETVGMPMVGAGLANGDWTIIAKIIEEEAKDFIPVVYIIDPKIFAELTQHVA
jgi:O-acetyl-ADP-ribose deacetylase (regulator of RNase III)